ncbi:hypothetical protein SDC9_183449 [bioreactor metagenome]|uniref:Uncharacterized protein n=1 Tax=bioreactor metagenome TaxID=1076179 RepID=A0A645HIJ4_9ZZZZ
MDLSACLMSSSTGSAASSRVIAAAASLAPYPSEHRAATACAAAPAGAAAAPCKSASEMPSARPLPTLSLSSSTMRWPSFGPTPLAAVNAFASPADTASATRSLGNTDKMASPALGPTPDTLVSSRNICRSASVAKPNRAISFSLRFK